MIPIFEPFFSGNEKKYLKDCIDSSWISSQGEYILKFEQSLSTFHGVKHAIATSNCTSALHLSLKALGIGPGDEVVCPNLTFIAPANMIVLSGAELVLVDIDKNTLTLDVKAFEKKINHKTKAVIVVHQFGHAAHMDEILEISKKHNLKIIEDNAESIGAFYKDRLLGTIGDISTNSFFGNKIITTGEGGAVLTNDDRIAIKCRELRDHGMNHKKKYHHVDLGFNYRMTNMQAALGLAQTEKLDIILQLRNDQMNYYYDRLSNVKGIHLRKFSDWCTPVHWIMTISLDPKYNRNDFIHYMKKEGIDCRQMVNPVNEADHFIEKFQDLFPVSKKISNSSVHLPSSTGLTHEQIDFIVKKIKEFLK